MTNPVSRSEEQLAKRQLKSLKAIFELCRLGKGCCYTTSLRVKSRQTSHVGGGGVKQETHRQKDINLKGRRKKTELHC